MSRRKGSGGARKGDVDMTSDHTDGNNGYPHDESMEDSKVQNRQMRENLKHMAGQRAPQDGARKSSKQRVQKSAFKAWVNEWYQDEENKATVKKAAKSFCRPELDLVSIAKESKEVIKFFDNGEHSFETILN